MWGLCHCGSNSWLLLRGRDRDPEGGRAVDHRPIDLRAPGGVYPEFQRQPAVRNRNNKAWVRPLDFHCLPDCEPS